MQAKTIRYQLLHLQAPNLLISMEMPAELGTAHTPLLGGWGTGLLEPRV